MLKFSASDQSQHIDCEFEEMNSEGEVTVHSLKFTKMTIGDNARVSQLQQPLMGQNLPDMELWNRTAYIRLMCSLKHADTGEYFWPDDLQSFLDQEYVKEMIQEMMVHVDELNPVKLDRLEAKKKSS